LARLVRARPLTRESFAPFGDVLEAPAAPGRAYFDDCLSSARPEARTSLSLSHVEPAAVLPLTARLMERHEFSSQSFIPLVVGRWLVIVAPPAAGGGPDVSAAEALVAGPGRGITYRLDTWHHPLTVLDRPAIFAVVMWRDGTARDEEFVQIDPFLVAIE
jgi:ureidoglycolate lyase